MTLKDKKYSNKLLKIILRLYNKLYLRIDNLRGATFLKSKLEFLYLNNVLEIENGYYKWNYKNTEILSNDIRDFTEILIYKNII